MTEAEWLACDEPENMRQHVCNSTSERKRLLYMTAWCRCSWASWDSASKRAIETAERYADGLASSEEFRRAGSGAKLVKTVPILMGPRFKVYHLQYAQNLRDIVGNPFRPAAFSTCWRTDTAVALARQMYESREFGAMPILADALQDAGCENEDVLGHCRGEGPHVRGCWVVDQVLNKE